MKVLFGSAVLGVLLAISSSTNAQPRTSLPEPAVRPATDGILSAFRDHSLVALGEWHALAQEQDFYTRLLKDPRFARDVGNIVLETGDAAQQDTIDRYVNGEIVPYNDLRKVWADTTGWFPTVDDIGSMNVYATVRAINTTLPPEQRIKVWLGDPPIDWPKIKVKADWEKIESHRESFPASLIAREILAKGKKALVIYGVGHLGIYPGYPNLRTLLEADHPGALFIVAPYVGYADKSCAKRADRHFVRLPVPSLIQPVRGSSLERDILPTCGAGLRPSDVTEAQYEAANRNNGGLTSNALLYLGPRDQFVSSSKGPDVYMDLEYRAELERRSQIRSGTSVSGPTSETNTAVPKPYWLGFH